MNTLLALLGLALSTPAALSNSIPEPQAAEVAAESVSSPEDSSQPEVIFGASVEVVQEMPDYSKNWLDGRVSFEGGEISSSKRQYLYAEANKLPLMQSEDDYQQNVKNGRFVKLSHPNLIVGASRPYVLPTTANFIYGVTEKFGNAGCGKLRVNGAGRLTTERPPNGSPHSVHPAGMALDLRVNNLSVRCYSILTKILTQSEAHKNADATREHEPPHFHIVVIPNTEKKPEVEIIFASNPIKEEP